MSMSQSFDIFGAPKEKCQEDQEFSFDDGYSWDLIIAEPLN